MGVLKRVLFFMVIGICLAITMIPPFLDRVYYLGPVSAHFDGERFFNPEGDDTTTVPTGGSRGGFIARMATGQTGRAEWPSSVKIIPSKPAARVEGETMLVTWVGHATLLIQTQGLNILTDPIWAERAGPFGIGPQRVAEPGIRFGDLPKIDLVVVSHNHYDHMDLSTIKRLWDRDKALIVSSLGNDTLIRNAGAKAKALDWGQRTTIRPGIDVVVTRNHHWSTRWGTDNRRALWSSFVIILPGGNLFFAGDTGFGDGKWGTEAAQYGPVRFAAIPIGAFRFQPGQMHTAAHIGPMQAERIFASLGAATALPIHWGTFQLSNEARETPPKMLAEVMKCAGYRDPSVFAARPIGSVINVPPLPEEPVAMPPAPDPRCLADKAITGLP